MDSTAQLDPHLDLWSQGKNQQKFKTALNSVFIRFKSPSFPRVLRACLHSGSSRFHRTSRSAAVSRKAVKESATKHASIIIFFKDVCTSFVHIGEVHRSSADVCVIMCVYGYRLILCKNSTVLHCYDLIIDMLIRTCT